MNPVLKLRDNNTGKQIDISAIVSPKGEKVSLSALAKCQKDTMFKLI